jgi:hypothetical protein
MVMWFRRNWSGRWHYNIALEHRPVAACLQRFTIRRHMEFAGRPPYEERCRRCMSQPTLGGFGSNLSDK